MSGAIVDLSATGAPPPETVEVCVIGSGPGGATAARTIAEAGHQVVVLEEGGDFTGAKLTRREAAMYDQLYMDRGGRMTTDLSISVLQGRVLGGGAVVNACDVVPVADPTLRHWQKHYGLTEFTPERIEPYRQRALQDLSARRIPEDQVNPANRLLRTGAEKLRWKGEVFTDNRKGCQGLGTCLIGCSANAKQNPRFVAIPAAIEAGARFWIRARAARIDGATGELKTITVRSLDAKGYRENGETTLKAKVVVVAANAVGSAALLLRSGIGNEHVGRNLSLQPQLPVMALFEDDVRAFYGIPQSYAVTEFERMSEDEGLGGFRIEGIMGTPGIVASILPVSGRTGKELMSLYPRVAAALCLCPDRPSGTVKVLASGRPIVEYTQTDELHARFRDAAKAAARIYLAAGATAVSVPAVPLVKVEKEADLSRIDSLEFGPASAPLLSAHQQGTVRFAPSASGGGANPDGQVYGTRDVYVFDSSGFPTSSSSHTTAPILTFSHYLSDKLVARLKG